MVISVKTVYMLFLLDVWKISHKHLTELSQIGIRDKIRAFNKDVIVLQGDIDDDVTLDSTNYFMQFFPSAELVVIKDGEHGFFDEQLEQA